MSCIAFDMRIFAMAMLASMLGCGCARSDIQIRTAIRDGRIDDAMAKIDHGMGVASSDMLPARETHDRPLLLLERATLQEAQSNFEASRRDFTEAETALDFKDITRGVGNRKWLNFLGPITVQSPNGDMVTAEHAVSICQTDDAMAPYRTTPTERLLLTILNTINYLAVGNAPGAVVESRRRFPIERFAEDRRDEIDADVIAFAESVAAFAEEASANQDTNEDASIFVVATRGRGPSKWYGRRSFAAAMSDVEQLLSPGEIALIKKDEAERRGHGEDTSVDFPILTLSPEAPATALAIDGAAIDSPITLDVQRALADEWSRVRLRHEAAHVMCARSIADVRGWDTIFGRITMAQARVAPGKHLVRIGDRSFAITSMPHERKTVPSFAFD